MVSMILLPGIPEEALPVNAGAILLLTTSGLIGMIFILRWMIRFQREFTDFYVEENTKLRGRIDDLDKDSRELKLESKTKDETIALQARSLSVLEIRVQEHEATISRLSHVIDRRKLEG